MFNKTLYYPWLDIHDDSWIKTAILYWDEINTIVPYSVGNPYQNEVSILLEQEGILRPFHVSPSSREVIEASEIAMQYLSTPEGVRVLTSNDGYPREFSTLYRPLHQRKYTLEDFQINMNKLSTDLINNLGTARIDDNGYLSLQAKFASYYMSVLANRVANNNGLSTVADSQTYREFQIKLTTDGYTQDPNRIFVKCPRCKTVFERGTQESIRLTGKCHKCGVDVYYFSQLRESRFQPFRAEPQHLVDGMLAELAIQSVYIQNSVPIEKLLKFRADHSDELAAFRGALQDITQSILHSGDIDDIRALRQKVEVSYSDKVKPQINCLKSQLKGARINYLLSDFSISGLASIIGATSGSNLSTTALLAGAGVSIGIRSLMYMQQKREIASNPYSYVLSMESKLS